MKIQTKRKTLDLPYQLNVRTKGRSSKMTLSKVPSFSILGGGNASHASQNHWATSDAIAAMMMLNPMSFRVLFFISIPFHRANIIRLRNSTARPSSRFSKFTSLLDSSWRTLYRTSFTFAGLALAQALVFIRTKVIVRPADNKASKFGMNLFGAGLC